MFMTRSSVGRVVVPFADPECLVGVRGCSRLPRHLPDQTALSFATLLRQDSGVGISLHTIESNNASWRMSTSTHAGWIAGSEDGRCRHDGRAAHLTPWK
jgi:hypothetical protein